jgi:hypothetical protein
MKAEIEIQPSSLSALQCSAIKFSIRRKGKNTMKYILMMNCPRKGYELMGTWPKKAMEAHIAFMHNLNKDLREAGELAAAEGLADPKQAVIVRVGEDGAPVTDGVFPESKEFLAGYWIVDVESEKRAHEIAARASSAPGADGKPFVIPIEVRQVMSCAPHEFA